MALAVGAGRRQAPYERRRGLLRTPAHEPEIRDLQWQMFAADFALVAASVLLGHLSRFGWQSPRLGSSGWTDTIPIGYLPFSIALAAVWMAALSLGNTYEPTILGSGTEEYRRVADVTVTLFGLVAIVSYLLKISLARGYFLTVLPTGLVLLLIGRRLMRQHLARLRSQGVLVQRSVILGNSQAASEIVRHLARHPEGGLAVVGACVAGDRDRESATLPGTDVPVLGSIDDYLPALQRANADTLIISAFNGVSPRLVEEIGWQLDPHSHHLVVAPSIANVAGPRMHMSPVEGTTLIHVDFPEFLGWQWSLKRVFDVVASGLLLILLAPLFVVVAAAIKLDDHGPVFFHQCRVGYIGHEFPMLKFRSMVVDAEARLDALIASGAAHEAGNTVLFKMRHDPRVTRVGRFLRRWSIDELPQLVNVLRGDMSLIGPRPPLPREVASYQAGLKRKFLVKPGITGLWQVSGRSDLSWEESVRLDLYYVENWSPMQDARILFRTIRAVLRRQGAY